MRKKFCIRNLKYSQNFLKSSKLVEELITKSSISKDDVVYEIGPGRGIITEHLARQCRKVIAIELDRKLYKRLTERFREDPRVEIKFGDFLQYKLPRNKKYKIFANVPFNVTADIVRKLTSGSTSLPDAFLVVQKEAAERFAGLPYYKECQYSILLKPYCEFEILHHFKRSDFSPRPCVDVVLLRITRRYRPLIKRSDARLFKDFVIYGFNQWKVGLRKAFKYIFTYRQFMRLTRDLDFSKDAKPTDLSFKQWVGLFGYFIAGVEKSKRVMVIGAERRLMKEQNGLQKVHRTRGIVR
jgi:23S rRNA (adenine-N6)-dimethyltransferase